MFHLNRLSLTNFEKLDLDRIGVFNYMGFYKILKKDEIIVLIFRTRMSSLKH